MMEFTEDSLPVYQAERRRIESRYGRASAFLENIQHLPEKTKNYKIEKREMNSRCEGSVEEKHLN